MTPSRPRTNDRDPSVDKLVDRVAHDVRDGRLDSFVALDLVADFAWDAGYRAGRADLEENFE
jgi:hypothetical protein